MLTDNKTLIKRTSQNKWQRWYTDREKLEAAKLYLITGNQATTAASLGIHKNTFNIWVNSQWFKELCAQIKSEGTIQLTNKLRTIASKALDVTMDRLENGEYIYDQKTGNMIRKPVQARDAHKIAVDFLEQSNKQEATLVREVTNDAVSGRLNQLAEAFSAMAGKTTRVEQIEVIEPVALP